MALEGTPPPLDGSLLKGSTSWALRAAMIHQLWGPKGVRTLFAVIVP
jgi:hypothetical protein